MAQYPQSWFKNTSHVSFGYLLTTVAALPASAVGWGLLGVGMSRLSAILIAAGIAVLVGLIGEGLLYLLTNKLRLVQISVGMIRVVIVTTEAASLPESKHTPAVNLAEIRLA